MTLLGKTSAVVSLGFGCQTASQLLAQRELVAAELGEDVIFASSLFNWVVSTPSGIAEFFERKFGEAVTSDELVKGSFTGWRFRDLGIWLVHDTEDRNIVAAKYTHLSQKMVDLRSVKRRYFVINNTQNSLYRDFNGEERDYKVTERNLQRIAQALEGAFPNGSNTLLVCSRQKVGSRTYAMPDDQTVWEGSPENWAKFIKATLSSPSNRLKSTLNRFKNTLRWRR